MTNGNCFPICFCLLLLKLLQVKEDLHYAANLFTQFTKTYWKGNARKWWSTNLLSSFSKRQVVKNSDLATHQEPELKVCIILKTVLTTAFF